MVHGCLLNNSNVMLGLKVCICRCAHHMLYSVGLICNSQLDIIPFHDSSGSIAIEHDVVCPTALDPYQFAKPVTKPFESGKGKCYMCIYAKVSAGVFLSSTTYVPNNEGANDNSPDMPKPAACASSSATAPSGQGQFHRPVPAMACSHGATSRTYIRPKDAMNKPGQKLESCGSRRRRSIRYAHTFTPQLPILTHHGIASARI